MYQLTDVIPNENPESLIPEVSFHPDGSTFAVSYHDNNEVRFFDSATRAPVRILSNPVAGLDGPHGVAVTEKHIIVSNSHGFAKPSRLHVFRIDDPLGKPVSSFETPIAHLREAHSLAVRDHRLVITYCENISQSGAVVSYRFDDETGSISGPVDLQESCFRKLGDTKGISFDADGSRILVSFNTRKAVNPAYKLRLRFSKAVQLLRNSGPAALIEQIEKIIYAPPRKQEKPPPILENGIAIFEISAQGKFSQEPSKVLLRKKFCRLENINLVGDTCVVADTVNNRVHLHHFESDPELKKPFLTLAENLVLPHGVKLSPDKRILVVTNFGLQVIQGIIQWKSWVSPRQDKVLVYELRQ